MCNLLLPGAAKSGTSSLHAMLDQHPDIAMSEPKEPHFFAIPERLGEGAAVHNALFDGRASSRYYGEASTLYLPLESALQNALQALNTAKIIILLRHPVERCVSHYTWLYRLGYERRPLREAVETDGQTLNPNEARSGTYMGYLRYSNYARFVPLWQNAFGFANTLLLRSEDLTRAPQTVLDRCFAHLGLASYIAEPVRLNETCHTRRKAPTAWMTYVERKVPRRILRALRYGTLRSQTLRALTETTPPQFSVADTRWLADQLADDIRFFDQVEHV
jgi:hypothetical protein